MADREKALEDYKAGMSYKEIAYKYCISESTVKSWASRYWNKDKKIKAVRNKSKKLQPKAKKSCNFFNEKKSQQSVSNKRNKGAPPGNKNAVGSKGPIKHGGYSSIYWDTLDEEEREMIDDLNSDEEHQLVEQLKLYSVRERRLLKAIKKIKNSANKADDVEVSSSVFFAFENKERTVANDQGETKTQTIASPKPSGSRKDYEKTDFAVNRLEKELTSVQRSKTKVINSLAELRRQNGDNSDEWLNDFFETIDEVENEN